MQTDFTGRVAIVTGGSRGIGRESAARLGRDGFNVVVSYGSNKDEGEQAVDEVVAAGGKAIAVQVDVADEASVAALFDQAEQAFGGVDVVVHAAGIMRLAPVAELDLNELDAHLRTNVRGTFAVDQRGRDITVNAVAPGPTATALFLDGKSQELIDRMAAEPPLERIGTPADLAELVAFLAGPGRWVNGQDLYANGGAA